MADIKKMKERLASLLAKARDAGATPHEVNEAMKAAQKLSERYGISEADLDAEQYAFEERASDGARDSKGKPLPHVLDRKLGLAIAEFCGAKAWISAADQGAIAFFGLDSDVELAMWMRAAIRMQYDADWERFFKFKRMNTPTRTKGDITEWKLSFIAGFVNTMRDRLTVIAKNSGAASTALVVRKTALVEAEMERRNIHLARGRGRRNKSFAVHGDAFGAGVTAAKAASIGRGVSQRGVAAITSGGN